MVKNLLFVGLLALSTLACKKKEDAAPAETVTLDGKTITITAVQTIEAAGLTTVLAMGKDGAKNVSVGFNMATPTASGDVDAATVPITYTLSTSTAVEKTQTFGKSGEKITVTVSSDKLAFKFTNLSETGSGTSKLSGTFAE